MSLTDTVAGTVLGGFIAGIVGLLTTRYERSLRRKETHMREHEKNFDVIQDLLLELKPQLWPIAKGAENFMLPRWKKPPYTLQLGSYSIAQYHRFEKLPGSPLDTVFRTTVTWKIGLLSKVCDSTRVLGFKFMAQSRSFHKQKSVGQFF